MKLTLHEIARVVGAQNDVTAYPDQPVHGIEFDSRKIQAGDLFLPLQGARDGHDFIPQAFENGALATFSTQPIDHPHLLVTDPLAAFQTLASYYLEKMAVQVFAVTGSNGKTTTKDMLASLLATTYPTYKTQGNYNNEIGLPYTVLHMPDETEKIVLEMGQDHLGDIHLLSTLAKPEMAILTLVGEAHLEFFGTREKIAQGKMELVDGMLADGLLLLPNDPIVDAYLPSDLEVVRFGEGADLSVSDLVESKDSLRFSVNFLSQEVVLPVTGKYNATNAMIAAYVAQRAGVSEEKILAGLAQLTLTKNRTEWKRAANGAEILSDVYNANPTAMRLILETFQTIPVNAGGKKIAVLADMKELGEQAVQMHTALLTSLNPEVLDTLICYGDLIEELAQLASQIFPIGKVYFFKKNNQEDQFAAMQAKLADVLQPQDQVLLKGSNSMNLAQLVEALEASH